MRQCNKHDIDDEDISASFIKHQNDLQCLQKGMSVRKLLGRIE